MVKAIWNGKVIAQSDQTIMIEGNHYFPLNSVEMDNLTESDHKTVCHWKGEASYYDVEVDGEKNPDAAFRYLNPKPGSTERVGKDFSEYISFWHGVEVSS